MSPSNPCSQGSRNSAKEEKERFQESEGMEDTKATRPSRYNRADTHMNSQKLWQHEQGLHGSKPDGASVLRGEVDISLTQKLSLIENHSQRENEFSPTESLTGYMNHNLRAGPMPSEVGFFPYNALSRHFF